MNQSLSKFIVVTTLLMFMTTLSGCSDKLNIVGMPKPPKEGPPQYIIGWRHGCETGMGAYSNAYLRSRYQVRIDGVLMTDPNYNSGWRSGNRYCNYYTSKYLQDGPIDFGFLKQDLRSDDRWFKSNIEDVFRVWKTP